MGRSGHGGAAGRLGWGNTVAAEPRAEVSAPAWGLDNIAVFAYVADRAPTG